MAVDLRELVRNCTPLTGKIDERTKYHPLSPGIGARRSYSGIGASPIALPFEGTGKGRLLDVLGRQVPLVDSKFWGETWVRLLDAPGAWAHLTKAAVLRDHAGVDLSPQDRDRARSVLLASVFRPEPELAPPDGPIFGRFGAVATLTVLPEPGNPKRYDDAWLSIQWVENTTAMLRQLEATRGLKLEVAPSSRSVEFLIADDLGATEPLLPDRLRRLGYLLGIAPKVRRVESSAVGTIRGQITKSRPSQLVVLGDVDDSIVEAYTEMRGLDGLTETPASTADTILDQLRAQLPREMGLGPALSLLPERVQPEVRLRLPVKEPQECRHYGDNKYILDASDDLWWTRDFAQHGHEDKSTFKTFKKVSGDLIWNADHDEKGDVMNDKHRGDTLRDIPFSDMTGCDYVKAHVR